MGNHFLKTKDKLKYLMDTYNPPIKNAPALSDLMHKAGVMDYSENKKVSKAESIKNKARSIDNHLNGTMIDALWLKRYCDFFGCSADFFLYDLPYPTHEITDIEKATGLSRAAIESIQNMPSQMVEVINYLISTPDFYQAIGNLADYKLAHIEITYDSNRDPLKSRRLEERREKRLEYSFNRDRINSYEIYANQFFGIAAKKWIKQKQEEAYALSLEEMREKIDEHLQ